MSDGSSADLRADQGADQADRARSLSVIVPAYNEEAVLAAFHGRLSAVLSDLPLSAEIIYVNDGSRDRTLEILNAMRAEDPRLAVIDLSRNFGKEIALTAGIDHCQGDLAVLIDADLQDPPELIPKFIETWRETGADVIYAQRMERAGETWLKKATAAAFYRVMGHMGEVPIPPNTGDFRLMNRRAIEGVKALRERHRFMKGILSWVGYNQVALPYQREPRHAGNTKWNYWKLWNFAIEGMTSASIAPLRISSYLGLLIASIAFLAGIWIIIKTVALGDPVQGWPSLAVIVLFLGGVQLVVLGILGEYLGRLFNEAKSRPLYLLNAVTPSNLGAEAGSAGPEARPAIASSNPSMAPLKADNGPNSDEALHSRRSD